MSETFRPVTTLEISVRRRLPCWCQKFWTRCSALPDKARAEDDVRAARLDRPQQQRVLGRVVLEVGVLDDQDLAARGVHRGAHGPALAHVLLVEDHAHAVPAVPGRELLARAVGRAVVDDDDLLLGRLARDEPEDLVDRADLVVDGNQDGELHGLPE